MISNIEWFNESPVSSKPRSKSSNMQLNRDSWFGQEIAKAMKNLEIKEKQLGQKMLGDKSKQYEKRPSRKIMSTQNVQGIVLSIWSD